MREKYRKEVWVGLEMEKLQLVSVLLPCRCDNACELPGSRPNAVSDNQGFVNLAVLCIWYWRDVAFHIPVCSCKLGQRDAKVDNLEPPLTLPEVVAPWSVWNRE